MESAPNLFAAWLFVVSLLAPVVVLVLGLALALVAGRPHGQQG